MTFTRPDASLFVPDGLPPVAALARVTHLGLGAHPDDLEFMAFHGIIACYDHATDRFGGVTCTDGAGSPRSGPYAHLDDLAMRVVRRQEQNRAAEIGRYAAMVQLAHPSASLKNPHDSSLRDDLVAVLRATHPRVLYTHNLADKHDTHVAVAMTVLAAVRSLPPQERPATVYGCEVWRDLDWLPDAEKIVLDVSGHDTFAAALNGAFASQITGGKRYDLGVLARRQANATFLDPHAVDQATQITFAMDLTPLVRDTLLDPVIYIDNVIERFRHDVRKTLSRHLQR